MSGCHDLLCRRRKRALVTPGAFHCVCVAETMWRFALPRSRCRAWQLCVRLDSTWLRLVLRENEL